MCPERHDASYAPHSGVQAATKLGGDCEDAKGSWGCKGCSMQSRLLKVCAEADLHFTMGTSHHLTACDCWAWLNAELHLCWFGPCTGVQIQLLPCCMAGTARPLKNQGVIGAAAACDLDCYRRTRSSLLIQCTAEDVLVIAPSCMLKVIYAGGVFSHGAARFATLLLSRSYQAAKGRMTQG